MLITTEVTYFLIINKNENGQLAVGARCALPPHDAR